VEIHGTYCIRYHGKFPLIHTVRYDMKIDIKRMLFNILFMVSIANMCNAAEQVSLKEVRIIAGASYDSMFSPSGKYISFRNTEGSYIYDRNLKLLWRYKNEGYGHSVFRKLTGFTSNDEYFAFFRGTINILRISDFKIVQKLTDSDAHTLTFSSDNRFIASGLLLNKCAIIVWEFDGDQFRKYQEINPKGIEEEEYCWVSSIAFSSSNDYLASTYNNYIVIWKMGHSGFVEYKILKKHNDDIGTLAFSHSSKYLASGSDNGQFVLWKWDGDNFKSHAQLEFGYGVYSVSFHPTRSYIAVGTARGTQIYNYEDNELLLIADAGNINRAYSVGFSPDGNQLISQDGNRAVIWDLLIETQRESTEGNLAAKKNKKFAGIPIEITAALIGAAATIIAAIIGVVFVRRKVKLPNKANSADAKSRAAD
jgi:WD40 repeat protein